MLYTIIVVLLLLWLFGFMFEVAGGLIHVLLVAALIAFIYNMLTRNRTVVK